MRFKRFIFAGTFTLFAAAMSSVSYGQANRASCAKRCGIISKE